MSAFDSIAMAHLFIDQVSVAVNSSVVGAPWLLYKATNMTLVCLTDCSVAPLSICLNIL
jgi:hypothetical protein